MEKNIVNVEDNEQELRQSQKEIEEMLKNIKILNDGNFAAEMKISKTRKYIRHCEREQKEIIDNLNWELNDWNEEFQALEKVYFNVKNAYNKDTAFLKREMQRPGK